MYVTRKNLEKWLWKLSTIKCHYKLLLWLRNVSEDHECWIIMRKRKSSWTTLPNLYKFSLLPNPHAKYFSLSLGKHCNSLSKIQGKRQNKSAKYVLFVCRNPWNGNLTQVGSRSFLGSWELLGIFKSLFVFTLENQALASAPLNPPLRTQRNAKCQWSDCTSTFREGEMEVQGLTLCSAMLLWGLEVKLYSHCQRCPSLQTAKDHHWLTLISEQWQELQNRMWEKKWWEICQNE